MTLATLERRLSPFSEPLLLLDMYLDLEKKKYSPSSVSPSHKCLPTSFLVFYILISERSQEKCHMEMICSDILIND